MDISAYASGSGGNLYRVSDGQTPLLLEAGLSIAQIRKALEFRLPEIAGCLVTHEHMDHAKSVLQLMKAGVDVYMSQGTADALKATGHRVRPVKALEQAHIGSWTVLPFETEHDAAEPLGFLLATTTGEKLIYATDTYFLRYRFAGLTHVMIECNYAADVLTANVQSGRIDAIHKNRVLKSHMSLEAVKGFLRANDLSRVGAIWLLHLSNDNADEDRFKREIQELTGRPVYVAPERMGGA